MAAMQSSYNLTDNNIAFIVNSKNNEIWTIIKRLTECWSDHPAKKTLYLFSTAFNYFIFTIVCQVLKVHYDIPTKAKPQHS